MPDNQRDVASAQSGEPGAGEPRHRLRDVAREGRAAFVVSRLEASDVEAYGDLTVPAYRSLLARNAEDGSVVAVGGSRFSRAIGLAIARLSSDGTTGAVLWLFVRPGYRRIGMGTALLAAVAELLAEQGCHRLNLTYPDGIAADAGLETLFRRAGWSPTPGRAIPPPVEWIQKTSGRDLADPEYAT